MFSDLGLAIKANMGMVGLERSGISHKHDRGPFAERLEPLKEIPSKEDNAAAKK